MTRKKTLIILAAVALLCIAGGGAYYAQNRSGEPPAATPSVISASQQELQDKPKDFTGKTVTVKGRIIASNGYYELVADDTKTYRAVSLDFSKTKIDPDEYAVNGLVEKPGKKPLVNVTGEIVLSKDARAPRLMVAKVVPE